VATIVRTPDTIQQGVALKAAWLESHYAPAQSLSKHGPPGGCQSTPAGCTGYFHYFDPNNPATSLTAPFSNAKSARGIGDVVLCLKGTVFQGERAAVALGADTKEFTSAPRT